MGTRVGGSGWAEWKPGSGPTLLSPGGAVPQASCPRVALSGWGVPWALSGAEDSSCSQQAWKPLPSPAAGKQGWILK